MVTIDLYSACNLKPSREQSLAAMAKLFAPKEARTDGELVLQGRWPGGTVDYKITIAGYHEGAIVYAEIPSVYEGITKVFVNSIKRHGEHTCTFCIDGELIEYPVCLDCKGETEYNCVAVAIEELVPKACDYLKKIEELYLDAIMNE